MKALRSYEGSFGCSILGTMKLVSPSCMQPSFSFKEVFTFVNKLFFVWCLIVEQKTDVAFLVTKADLSFTNDTCNEPSCLL